MSSDAFLSLFLDLLRDFASKGVLDQIYRKGNATYR